MTTTGAQDDDVASDDGYINGKAKTVGRMPDASNMNDMDTTVDLPIRNSSPGFPDEELTDFGIAYKKIRNSQTEDFPTIDHDVVGLDGQAELPTPDGSLPDPDETPSIRSSRSGSLLQPARSPFNRSRTGSSASRPFDRRFHARMSSSASSIPRIGAPPGSSGGPSFLRNDSRRISMLSQFTVDTQGSADKEGEEEQAPWDVVKWSKLKKVTTQSFSEAGKRTFGRPVCLTVGALIAIGTSKGLLLLFDYQQTLKSIIGQGTAATESGPVTSLAFSADHTTIATGHANGSIFTWELASPARPFLTLLPTARSSLFQRKVDGHIEGCAVLHIGFLGQRRTALVSADDHGMAFSHLASRGLGAVARTIRTTRVLGRYPELNDAPATRKPSSVMGFASLPLGNIQRHTDEVGLTAILTPYLLVIVSTMPIAQTQFKLSREKHLDPHSAMTGCLAWFPAVKLAASSSRTSKTTTSNSKLVYCWSTVLSVIDVEEIPPPLDEPDKGPSFNFTPRSQWRSEEAIVAVQWLSRSVIAVLTVSQRLVILEDGVMRQADSSDLNAKHIYHQDLYSQRLKSVVDKTEDGENSLHGVIPDAFHMSFKTHKGRLFLLGFGDVLMGVLSNWADRLQALLDRREYLTAIKLGDMYYTGEIEKATIGLSEDDNTRHTAVAEKLLEIMSAALQYLFNDDTDDNEMDFTQVIRDLAEAIFRSCLTINEKDFLFDTMYEYYSDASRQDTFLYTLEPYILEHDIDVVPPQVMKDLLIWYASNDLGPRLEDIICAVQPFTIDIDQVTTICKSFGLYDALAYVWSQALGDYVTPLIAFLKLVHDAGNDATTERAETAASKLFPFLAYTLTGRRYPDGENLSEYDAIKAKASLYGFLFSSSPVIWPGQRGNLITIGPDSNNETSYPYLRILLHFDTDDFLSMLNEVFEDSFLNGGSDQTVAGLSAAELREESFGMIVNRQRITNILLEVMRLPEYTTEERIYLDIFVARNLSKFSQFILLPGTVIRQVLAELCHGDIEDMVDERQLSVEYLLSVYHPSDMQDLIDAFSKARFFRILKSVYKNDKQYAKWLETYFDDPDSKSTVFTAIAECFKSGQLHSKQITDIKNIIVQHAQDLAEIDTLQTVLCLHSYAPDLMKAFCDQYKERPQLQFTFLETVYESSLGRISKAANHFTGKHNELYVRLMCQYNPTHVADYVSLLKSGDLHLNNILPAMEVSGVIDAAVILLARDGLVSTAMSRLIKHLSTLETAITGLLKVATTEQSYLDMSSNDEAITDLLGSVAKYIKLGIWLCQGQAQSSKPTSSSVQKSQRPLPNEITEDDLTTDEHLWLDFLDMVVGFSRDVSSSFDDSAVEERDGSAISATRTKTLDSLRLMVQQTFTALLAATSSVTSETQRAETLRRPGSKHTRRVMAPQQSSNKTLHTNDPPIGKSSPPPNSFAFLRILRCLLHRLSTNATSPASLPSLRAILSQIFSAYTFESSLLDIASGFLDKDVFLHIEDAENKRKRGWTPNSQGCEACGRKLFGKGLGVDVWDAWKSRADDRQQRRNDHLGVGLREGRPGMDEWRTDDDTQADRGVLRRTLSVEDKGKGRAKITRSETSLASEARDARSDASAHTLVVFACGHAFHRSCLRMGNGRAIAVVSREEYGNDGDEDWGQHEAYTCPICLDGTVKL